MSKDYARIDALENQIIVAKHAYYNGEPVMTDQEYDALEDQLRTIDPQNPTLYLTGAPVSTEAFRKAGHSIHMGSQNKVNSEKEFALWMKKSTNGSVLASLKLDGASVAFYYDNGLFFQAITRGDGFIGEDITQNAVHFKGLPRILPGFQGSIRAEVLLKVEDWIKIDPGKEKNPRNIGTGIMMRYNGQQCNMLSVVAFDIEETGVTYETEGDKFKRLIALGFEVAPHAMCDNTKQAENFFEFVKRERDNLPYWIDGVVYRVNAIDEQLKLGVQGNRPKGQVAWKFDSSGCETTVLGVTVSGGHTGALIPTAQLAVVNIGGSKIANASLANFDEVQRLDIGIGDKVWLIKANDIIPKIVRVTERVADRVVIKAPTVCPFCGGLVGKKMTTLGQEGGILYCLNPGCHKKSFGKISRWITSLDIQGIGDSILMSLIERFDLKDAADLYTLKKYVPEMSRIVVNPEHGAVLGARRAHAICSAIEARNILPLELFMGSLGIEYLGKRRAKLMIQYADGALDTLQDWLSGKLKDPTFAALVGVPNTGAVIQDRIDEMKPIIEKLLSVGVIVTPFIRNTTHPSYLQASKTVCISGKLPSGKKKSDYAKPLLDKGYQLVEDVDKSTTYLVVADPDAFSLKNQKALKLGVNILTETELMELLK